MNHNFQVNDEVVCINILGANLLTLNKIYKITEITKDTLKLNGILHKEFFISKFISVREAVSNAIDLLDKYQIGKYSNSKINGKNYFWGIDTDYLTKQKLLDKIFPTYTKEELEIKSIENEMRILADRLNNIKGHGKGT